MKTIQKALTGILVCMCLIVSAQTAKDTKTKMIDRILGTWQIQKIYDGKKEVSSSDARVHEFQFNVEGHYKSSVGNETLDSGSYRISESASLLYLENKRSVLPGKISQVTWKITFADNIMTMQGQGSEASKKIRYVFIKTKEGSNSTPN